MARPRKIQWPIGFQELLRFALKQKQPAHRIKFYRLYLRDFLRPHTNVPASEEEIEKAFLNDSQRKFGEPEADQIRRWMNMSLDKWKSEHFRHRAKAAGYKSWSKKARKTRKTNLKRKLQKPA